MEIKDYNGLAYDRKILDDDLKYAISITAVDDSGNADRARDADILLTGKEIKRIMELINTFNKIQDDPSPLTGLGDMLGILKKFGAK